MKYLSLDIIDTSSHPYPDILSNISITIRGTKNLYDIFFSASDLETSFSINLPYHIDFAWVNTPSGKEKYLSYPTMKRVLYHIIYDHKLVEPYLIWVDSLIFVAGSVKPFFRHSNTSSYSTVDSIDDKISDLDDSSSVGSFDSIQNNEYILTSLQHKIEHLENELKLKDKDIEILNRDVEIRNKEIELLNLRLTIPSSSEWL